MTGAADVPANPYGMPIGLQLFTVDDHMQKDFEGTLQKVAQIGYRQVELGGFDFYGKKPAELRRILGNCGIKALSLHYNQAQLRSDPAKQIANAKECGITWVGLNMLPEEDRKTPDAIHRAAAWFNQIGKTVHGAGCHFFYHGHNFDYATVDGAVVYDELIRRTDPELVNFELDCFWCVRAGRDPVDYFHRFPGRFPQLHIKDLKPGFPPTTRQESGPSAFTEVGQGVIDWKRIFTAAPEGGLKNFYVEQDQCDRDSLESARISYAYLHKLNL
jgi:sugar phosphate isomerase/epimerase